MQETGPTVYSPYTFIFNLEWKSTLRNYLSIWDLRLVFSHKLKVVSSILIIILPPAVICFTVRSFIFIIQTENVCCHCFFLLAATSQLAHAVTSPPFCSWWNTEYVLFKNRALTVGNCWLARRQFKMLWRNSQLNAKTFVDTWLFSEKVIYFRIYLPWRESRRRKWKSWRWMLRPTAYFENTGDANPKTSKSGRLPILPFSAIIKTCSK